MMKPILEVVPGGAVDQVARREQFEHDRPDADITRQGSVWTGSLIVCRKRWKVNANRLGPLLDELDALAVLDTEAAAVGRDYPGWHLWVSSLNRWWAVRQGPDARWTPRKSGPITLTDDDLAGLRTQLVSATAAYGSKGTG